jgi:aspartate/methionine/tyrosine aminotransferase
MDYKRMPIEIESPEEMGYSTIRYNLAESSVRDLPFNELHVDLSHLVLAYTEHRGSTALRSLILENSTDFHIDDVLVTTGAAMALFVTATTLLDKNDHIVVIRPNYATNLETPRAIGCEITIVDLDFDQNFDLFTEGVLHALKPNTKVISLTNPHNPTGKLYSQETIKKIIAIAETHGCYVIVDETYRDLNFQTPLLPYMAALSEKVISVSSLSKAFGAPGIRIGWLICRDKQLMHKLLAAKEQMILGNAVIDEAIAEHLLAQKASFLQPIHAHIRDNFGYMKQWMSEQSFLEWVEPTAGVVCFPRLKAGLQFDSFSDFQNTLYRDYQTVVGYGHWFEQSERYFRIGFGYPTKDDLVEGLRRLTLSLEKHVF